MLYLVQRFSILGLRVSLDFGHEIASCRTASHRQVTGLVVFYVRLFQVFTRLNGQAERCVNLLQENYQTDSEDTCIILGAKHGCTTVLNGVCRCRIFPSSIADFHYLDR